METGAPAADSEQQWHEWSPDPTEPAFSDDKVLEEFVDLGRDPDVLLGERKPLCIALNAVGTRLGVGGETGFRIFQLLQCDGGLESQSTAGPSSTSCGPSSTFGGMSLQLVTRFPSLDGHSTPKQATSVGTAVGSMALLGDFICAVSGGGEHPIGPLNQVLLFTGTTLERSVKVSHAVRRIVLVPQMILVLTTSTFEICSFAGVMLFCYLGACGGDLAHPPAPLATHLVSMLAAFSEVNGTVKILQLSLPDPALALSVGPREPIVLTTIEEVHKNTLSSMCFNFDGSLLATCSERGTLIRVWNVCNGGLVKELRIGIRQDSLGALCFVGNFYVAGMTSTAVKLFFVGNEEGKQPSKQTQAIEFWDTKRKEEASLAKNQTSSLATFAFLSSYLASKWAVTEASIPPDFSMSPQSVRKVEQPVPSTSWASYLASWVPTTSGEKRSLSVPTEQTYVPTHVAELSILWWPHPQSKFYTELRASSSGTRSRSNSVQGSAPNEESDTASSTLNFYAANCDGKLLRMIFDYKKGSLCTAGPFSPTAKS